MNELTPLFNGLSLSDENLASQQSEDSTRYLPDRSRLDLRANAVYDQNPLLKIKWPIPEQTQNFDHIPLASVKWVKHLEKENIEKHERYHKELEEAVAAAFEDSVINTKAPDD